jgi:tetratricopeptide (TPR) repeat protein
LRLNPTDSRAENNRAQVLNALHQPEQALHGLQRAIALNPNDAELHYNRGNTLMALNRTGEALAAFEHALALNPGLHQARQNMGIALTRLGRAEEALRIYDALLLQPGAALPELRVNRAGTLDQLNRRADALADCDAALAENPAHAMAHWNAAIVCLSLGDYGRGWREWEWRWQTPDFARHRRAWASPAWLGQFSLAGKRILLHPEQGLGDTIQFCRYAPLVKALGGQTILEAPAPLLPLLRTLAGVDHLIEFGQDPGPIDCHTPLMSLPLALGTRLETVPAAIPYLAADPARVAAWRARLGPAHGPRVGLAWSGNPALQSDAFRSAPLAALAPLIAPGIEFISVQKDVRAPDAPAMASLNIRHFGPDLHDFADTAALISLLDLVISVDTAPAHLAGALGRPVWLLLHATAEWRWLMGRADSPWYPTARLFRQAIPQDWGELAGRVRAQLAELVPA